MVVPTCPIIRKSLNTIEAMVKGEHQPRICPAAPAPPAWVATAAMAATPSP
jgi:hypothetical protein